MIVASDGHTYDVQNRARRGDVLLVHTPLVVDHLGLGRDTIEGYQLGIVTRVSRAGIARRYDPGRGAEVDVPHGRRSWLIPASALNLDGLRDWLAGAENAAPLPTLDAARAVVECFRR